MAADGAAVLPLGGAAVDQGEVGHGDGDRVGECGADVENAVEPGAADGQAAGAGALEGQIVDDNRQGAR